MNNIFLETIYSNDNLKKVDDLFQIILDKTDINKDMVDPKETNKILKKISKYINSIFNMDCKLFIDNTMNNNINYGMEIFPSYEEMKNQINDAIEEKSGFKLIKCNNVSIEIEINLLKLFKSKNLNGRYLTAILLHEIGHKIYVETQHNLYKESNKKSKKIGIVSAFGNLVLIFLSSLDKLNLLNLVSLFLLNYLISTNILNYNSLKVYSKTESLSDDIAVKYGYGFEIYKALELLEKEINKNSNKSSIKIFQMIKNNFNYFYHRRGSIIKLVKLEMNNPNNSKEKRKYLFKILKDLKKDQNNDYGVNESISLDNLLFDL